MIICSYIIAKYSIIALLLGKGLIMDLKTKLYVFTIFILAICMGIFLYNNYYTHINIWDFLFFTILILLFNISFFIPYEKSLIAMNVPFLLVLLNEYSPFWVAIIFSVGSLDLYKNKNIFYKKIYNFSFFLLSAAIAALIYQYFDNNITNNIIILSLIATLIYYIMNHFLIFTVVKISTGENNLNLSRNLIINNFFSFCIGLLFICIYSTHHKKIGLLIASIFIFIIRYYIYANIQKSKIEKELAKKKETLKYSEMKNKLFRNLSHEFKTPINLISSANQMIKLLKKDVPKKQSNKIERYTGIINQNCIRLLRLVNNLIDITKFESGNYKLELKNINIVELINQITESTRQYIEEQNKKLVFETTADKIITACDPIEIERAILNLLSNAAKFTNAGDLIKVSINHDADNIYISVKDTGIGIPESKQRDIFDDFKQVNESSHINHNGSGIGLSIVKALVEMHNGKIELESKVNEFSKFIITIPIRVKEEERITDIKNISNDHNTLDKLDNLNI